MRSLSRFEEALTRTNEVFGLVAVGVLRLQHPPPAKVLRQALDALQQRHPLLRARIEKKRGRAGHTYAFAPVEPPRPLPLEVRDRRDAQQWEAVAEDLLNQPFEAAQGPLMRCVYLLDDAAGAADLLLAFHHAVMDAPSATRLYGELLAQCAALQAGQSPGGKPLPLQPAAEALLPSAFRGPRLLRHLLPFAARQAAEEGRFRREGPREAAPIPPSSRCRLHSFSLSESDTLALVRRSRREGVTLGSTLGAALLLAVYRRRHAPRPGRFRTIVFVDQRPHLHPPVSTEHLGCYISMLRLAVRLTPDASLYAVASSLGEAVYAANRRGERFLSAIVSKPLMTWLLRRQSERMGTTALSYAGPLALKESYGSIEVKSVHGFITSNRLGPELSAFAHLSLGRLHLDLMFMEADMGRQEAREIAQAVAHLLTDSITQDEQ